MIISTFIYRDETDIYIEVEVDYHPGRPAVLFLRNGDPGWDAEPEHFEILSVSPDIDLTPAEEKEILILARKQWNSI